MANPAQFKNINCKTSFLLPWNRRHFLSSGLGLSIIALTGVFSSFAFSKGSSSSSLLAFMRVSLRLTDRATLDPTMGQALLKNLIESDEKRLSQIVQMHKILKSKNWESARDFTRAVVQENSQLANVIRDILHGWYRGIVNNKVIVYQSAMMFTLTKNVLYPKTYANGEVFYWASKPPTILPTQTQPVMAPSIPKDLGQ